MHPKPIHSRPAAFLLASQTALGHIRIEMRCCQRVVKRSNLCKSFTSDICAVLSREIPQLLGGLLGTGYINSQAKESPTLISYSLCFPTSIITHNWIHRMSHDVIKEKGWWVTCGTVSLCSWEMSSLPQTAKLGSQMISQHFTISEKCHINLCVYIYI